MIDHIKLRGIIIAYLFFCILLKSCTTPEENNINPPVSDSTILSHEKSGPVVDTVEIKGMMFQPEEVTVHKGDTIIWVNHDLFAHCVTERKTKAWTSSKIESGATWKMAVENSADYFCAIHQVMKGKIVVE